MTLRTPAVTSDRNTLAPEFEYFDLECSIAMRHLKFQPVQKTKASQHRSSRYEARTLYFLLMSLMLVGTFVISPFLPQGQKKFARAQLSALEANALSTTDAEIDRFIEAMMAEAQIPGLSLAVVHDGKLMKVQSYGQLNRDRNIRVRPSSIFPIASISKPFTATAVMLLVQDGQLNLDDPISTYLSNIPEQF